MNYKVLSKILLASGLIYAALVFIVFPKWTIDDAYIIFRYAENFANHGVLTWNVGELPIEGYTGVLWTVFLTGFIKLGFSPIAVSHAVGILAFFAGWLLLFLSLKKLNLTDFISSVILLFYATSPILFTHALGGLETLLFIDAILLSFYCLLSARETPLFLSLLFTNLIRPEGAALALAFIIAAGISKFKNEREDFKFWLWKFILFYLLPALIYFIWRANYYGALLPNTFYAKEGVGISINNLIDISRFLRTFFAIPLLAAALLLSFETDWLLKRVKSGWEKFKKPQILNAFWSAIIFMILLVAVLARTHLLTNFSARFYTPLMPAFWLGLGYLFGLGLSALDEFKHEKPLKYKLTIWIFLVLSAYQILFQVVKLKDEIQFASVQLTLQETEHNLIGRELKNIVPPSEWLVVYTDAGAMPYFSGLKTIDFGKLNDPKLAREKLSPEEKIDYFYSKNPGAVVFTSENKDKLEYGAEAESITNDPRFKNYILYKKYFSTIPNLEYHQFLYLRKDLLPK